jgi:excisionase family DNA binding protein
VVALGLFFWYVDNESFAVNQRHRSIARQSNPRAPAKVTAGARNWKGNGAMAKQPPKSLTTSEFSKLTGIPTATVGKLLRDGKIDGKKVSGRWKIDADQVKRQAVKELSPKSGVEKGVQGQAAAKARQSEAKPSPKPGPPDAPSGKRGDVRSKGPAKTFSISEFSPLTYLTEYGVEQYLNSGRLRGSKDAQGNWRIDADNLEDPTFRHLIR